MVEKETIGQGPSSTPGHQGQQQEAGYWDDHASLVADGFQHSLGLPDLGAHIDAPPAYGDQHDQLQLSQAGIEAGANVTRMLTWLRIKVRPA